jgi:hypothetical protein
VLRRQRWPLASIAFVSERVLFRSSEFPTLSQPGLVKWSEHALGSFYLNPTNPDGNDRDWVRQAWEWILRSEVGLPTAEPAWLDLPALSRFTASHPRVLQPFAAQNKNKPYLDQIKPANFLLVAHVAPSGHPRGADPARFALLTPYEPDPRRWSQLAWRNVHDPRGPSYPVTTQTPLRTGGQPLPPNTVGVKSYRDVLATYRPHAEAKSNGPDGQRCRRHTVGPLTRRHIQAVSIVHIGKEANLLEEIAAGLINAEADALTTYDQRRLAPVRTATCIGCDTQLTGRQKRWCSGCRRSQRRRERATNQEPSAHAGPAPRARVSAGTLRVV